MSVDMATKNRPYARLLSEIGQVTCVYGARTCYDSHHKASPESDSGLLRRILPTKHYSVVRHSNAAFWVVSNEVSLFRLAISKPGKFLQITPHDGSTTRYYISGNYQAWRDALSLRLVPRGGFVLETLQQQAPDVFDDVPEQPKEVGRANIIFLGTNPDPDSDWKFTTEEIERHTRLCFEIVTSRGLSCQVHRHGTISISQRSQRYVDEGEADVIYPPTLQPVTGAAEDYQDVNMLRRRELMEEAVATGVAWYRDLTKLGGIKKEDARYALPGGVSTVQIATANLDMWKHFIWERALSLRAQHETRHCAQMILEKVYELYPKIFEREMQELHSHPELRTGYATQA